MDRTRPAGDPAGLRVQVLCIEGCPSRAPARSVTRAALDALGLDDVPVEELLVRTDAEAEALSFAGSPTILLDGVDLFPAATTGARACRVYRTEAGLSGRPTQAQLEAAIRARVDGG